MERIKLFFVKNRGLFLSFMIGLITSYIGTYLYNFCSIEDNSQEKNINNTSSILIGSGSVMNYLEEELDPITRNKFSFLSGPTLTGLEVLLANNDPSKNSIPISSMSCIKLDVNVIDSIRKIYQNYNTLLFVSFAKDTLVISYYSPSNEMSYMPKNGLISTSFLKELLSDTSKKFDLYLTNPNSGTRYAFEHFLGYNEDNWEKLGRNIQIYDKKSRDKIKKNKQNVIILTGNSYSYEKVEDGFEKLYVMEIDTSAHIAYAEKDLGLYFLEDMDVKIEENSAIKLHNQGRKDLLNSIFGKKVDIWKIIKTNESKYGKIIEIEPDAK